MNKRKKDCDVYFKYLAIIDIIMQNSDTNHPITIAKIQELLYQKNNNFNADFRLIKHYVDIYNEYHNRDIILYEKKGRSLNFYFVDRSLDTMEAKAIIDLVYSSDFFTKKTKDNYKERIKSMFSTHYKNYFNKNLDIHVSKNENDKVFYEELEKIIQAINFHKKIEFTYQKPRINNETLSTKHTLAPIDTIFSNNEYYLLCQGKKDHDKCIKYRLDYIQNVKIIEDSSVIFSPDDLYAFRREIRNLTYMYGEGDLQTIELDFCESVYSNIIDKFGKDIKIKKIQDDLFRVRVQHIINSTFYAWIIGFGGAIQISGDSNQVDKFEKFLQSRFINKKKEQE